MGGNQTLAEGLPWFRVSTILAGSTPLNSLQGGFDIPNLQQGAEVWVDDAKAVYRWEGSSTQTNDNVNVVTPTGVTGAGRFIKVGSTADIWGAGIVRADTLAALNALPAFSADYAILRGLVDADDQNGGLFKVETGLTADAWDQIDLSGVHSPKQLYRISPGMGTFIWANTQAGNVAFSAQDTPTFVTIPHIGIGQGPWSVVNNNQFSWDGEQQPDGSPIVSWANVLIAGTGTAGDVIRGDFSVVSGGPVAPIVSQVTIPANGEFILEGGATLSLTPGALLQLVLENRTSSNQVTVNTTFNTIFRIPGNADSLY